MDASLYHPLFFGLFCLWGAILALSYRASYKSAFLQKKESLLWGWIFTVIVAIWLGLRPISARYFGDMASYARIYNSLSSEHIGIDLETEWLWNSLGAICHLLNFSTQMYFVVVALLYSFCLPTHSHPKETANIFSLNLRLAHVFLICNQWSA